MSATSADHVRVRDIPGVLLDAARLIVRHWPALLTLAFVGVSLRGLTLWLAPPLAEVHNLLPHILLVLAPLGYLLPVIAMLHLFRESLPSVAAIGRMEGPEAATEGRERRLLDVAVSVLVPFLTVYVAAGFITQDREDMTNWIAYTAHQDALLEGLTGKDQGPALIERIVVWNSPVPYLVLFAAALLLRWFLGRFERKTGFLALAAVGALVEVYWSTQGAQLVDTFKAKTVPWVETRQASRPVIDGYDTFTGWVPGPVAETVDWVVGLFGSLDAVIIIPIAWLAVGAVVLGHKLNPPKPKLEETERWQRIPPKARSAVGALTEDLRERWSAFWGGLKMLAGAGLAPMLMFCLVFLLCLRLPELLVLVVRQVWGPVETNTWLAFSPIESGLALAVSMVITAALLAAAIDWVVRPQLAAAPEEPAAESTTA